MSGDDVSLASSSTVTNVPRGAGGIVPAWGQGCVGNLYFAFSVAKPKTALQDKIY